MFYNCVSVKKNIFILYTKIFIQLKSVFFLLTLISLRDANVLTRISKCNVVPLMDRIPLLPWWLRR